MHSERLIVRVTRWAKVIIKQGIYLIKAMIKPMTQHNETKHPAISKAEDAAWVNAPTFEFLSRRLSSFDAG